MRYVSVRKKEKLSGVKSKSSFTANVSTWSWYATRYTAREDMIFIVDVLMACCLFLLIVWLSFIVVEIYSNYQSYVKVIDYNQFNW